MFSHVLAPVDGSGPANRAATIARELGGLFDATVTVLHVESDVPRRDDESAGETILESAVTPRIEGEPTVRTRLETGRPDRVVANVVESEPVDLVVMGRRGRRGLSRRVLGSVTERVLRNVAVPVLTVDGGSGARDTIADAGTMVLTTDGSEESERVAEPARAFATTLDATVQYLSVVDLHAAAGPFDAGGLSPSFVEALEDDAAAAIDRLADRVGAPAERTVVRRGSPSEEIVTYVNETGVDLLAMASEGQTNIAGQVIGSVTRRVLQGTSIPVLVVPVVD
ncbi:MAG: universal stress protein [Halanaeroarchaeum sp.]